MSAAAEAKAPWRRLSETEILSALQPKRADHSDLGAQYTTEQIAIAGLFARCSPCATDVVQAKSPLERAQLTLQLAELKRRGLVHLVRQPRVTDGRTHVVDYWSLTLNGLALMMRGAQ